MDSADLREVLKRLAENKRQGALLQMKLADLLVRAATGKFEFFL